MTVWCVIPQMGWDGLGIETRIGGKWERFGRDTQDIWKVECTEGNKYLSGNAMGPSEFEHLIFFIGKKLFQQS